MRTKLKKRHAGALVAGLTLSIVTLAALHPGWAEAQEEVDAYAVSRLEAAAHNANDEQTNAAGATTPASQAAYYEPAAALRVVEPGDSLWSIAQQQLGPNATPQQVANEVERIYRLNQNQIGNNPDLILPNQELLLPSVGKPAASEPTASVEPGGSLWSIAHEQLGPNATPPQVADEVARIHRLNRDWIGQDPNLILPGQELSLLPVGESATAAEPAPPEPAPETAAVPEQPADESAAKKPAEAPAEPSYPDPDYANLLRAPSVLTLLLSLGFFLFALAVAAFGAWKLFRRRRLLRERYEPSIRHDWSGYYANYDQPRRQEQEEPSEPEAVEPAAEEGAPEPAAKPTPEKPTASRAEHASRPYRTHPGIVWRSSKGR